MSERKKHKTGINSLKKKNKFIVPEGYFENFSSRLQLKLQQQKESQQPRFGIFPNSRYRLAFAASLIGLIIITYAGIKYLSDHQNSSNAPTLEIAEVLNYQINDFDDNMIYDLYDETSIQDSDMQDVSDERILNEMIDYLVVSNIDLQLIAQEL